MCSSTASLFLMAPNKARYSVYPNALCVSLIVAVPRNAFHSMATFTGNRTALVTPRMVS
jgi:hypothetical protein